MNGFFDVSLHEQGKLITAWAITNSPTFPCIVQMLEVCCHLQKNIYEKTEDEIKAMTAIEALVADIKKARQI